MDLDTELQRLEAKKAVLLGWLESPVTKEVLQQNKEEEETAVALLCNVPVSSIETFFAHFEVVGFLRGLRATRNSVISSIDDLNREIREIENQQPKDTDEHN